MKMTAVAALGQRGMFIPQEVANMAQTHATSDTVEESSMCMIAEMWAVHATEHKPFNPAILAWCFGRLQLQRAAVSDVPSCVV